MADMSSESVRTSVLLAALRLRVVAGDGAGEACGDVLGVVFGVSMSDTRSRTDLPEVSPDLPGGYIFLRSPTAGDLGFLNPPPL